MIYQLILININDIFESGKNRYHLKKKELLDV